MGNENCTFIIRNVSEILEYFMFRNGIQRCGRFVEQDNRCIPEKCSCK